jgi:hypothetical protein
MAAASIDTHQWHECVTSEDPTDATPLVTRWVVCNGFAVRILLCPAHGALWDADYGRIAVWAGAPVADSARTGGRP